MNLPNFPSIHRIFRLFLAATAWLAVSFSVPEADAQMVLNRIDDMGGMRSMKNTEIDGKIYTALLFKDKLFMLDQNGAEVGSTAVTEGRALACNGETIYVWGKIGSASQHQLLKYPYSVASRKFEQVKVASAPAGYSAFNWGERPIDMVVTKLASDNTQDGKVWVMFLNGPFVDTIRFSEGAPTDAPKLDDVPTVGDGSTARNYIQPGFYRFGSGNSVFDILAYDDLVQELPLRLVADQDGKSFWLAITDQNRLPRVVQIKRAGRFDLAADKIAATGTGSLGGLWINNANSGVPNFICFPEALAVDSSYVYLTTWALYGESKIHRIPRSAFAAGASTDGGYNALPPGTTVATIKNANGTSVNHSKASSLVVHNGKVTVAGHFGAHVVNFGFSIGGSTLPLGPTGNHNIFVGSLLPDFTAWDAVQCLPESYENPTQPAYDRRWIKLAHSNRDASNVILAARFVGAGKAEFGTGTFYGGAGNAFTLLLSSKTNKPAQQRFILTVGAEGRAPNGTNVQPLNLADAGLTPGFGILSGEAGEDITVTVPESIYQRANGTFLNLTGISQNAVQDLIQASDVVARYRPSGYTVTRDGDPQTEIGAGNAVTVVMTKNTNVTFTFTREYALHISSDLAGLPGLDPVGGQSLGSPLPAPGKQWIADGDIVKASLDRTATSQIELGTRFLATGYTATGIVNRAAGNFDGTNSRILFGDFTMANAVSIVYKWRAQHSVTVSSSLADASPLPGILETKAGAILQPGTGTFWFDRNTEITVGASDRDLYMMKGVFAASGGLQSISTAKRGTALPDTFTVGTTVYRGKKLRLTSAADITWDYGDPSYVQLVPIGQAVSVTGGGTGFDPGDMLTSTLGNLIDKTVAPIVTVRSARSDTTTGNSFVWSTSEQKMYPVRPGNYSLKWQRTDGKTLEMEIVTGFPGDIAVHPKLLQTTRFSGNSRDLRTVVHADMPPIDLDPNDTDDTAFKQLSYSERLPGEVGASFPSAPKIAPSLTGNDSTSLVFAVPAKSDLEVEGRHVLVFSRAASGVAASGDLSKESVVVRILESRRWNAEKKWESTSGTNRVLSLNGTTSYVRTPLRNLGGNSLTIQYWFRGTNSQSAVRQQKGTDWVLAPWGGRKFSVSANPDPLGARALSAGADLESNTWKHVAVVWQRNSSYGFELFINGVKQSTVVTPDVPIPNIDAEVTFGAFWNGSAASEFTNGKIDEISIWNRALSGGEIQSYAAKQQLTGSEQGLLGYWNFDSDTAQDRSLNQNHGVLAGGAVIVPELELITIVPVDTTGNKMIASFDQPRPATIGTQLRDELDLAGIGTGFVTGSLAHYNVDLHDRGSSAEAGPIFPVNINKNSGSDHDLTVIWYEKRDSVLWPWRPRKYVSQWPVNINTRIVVASQLGSDGFEGIQQKVVQRKYDPAMISDLEVYSQNDPALPGYNPNEEHAFISGSLRYAAQQPTPNAVYALRRDLNRNAASLSASDYTSEPIVLAQFKDAATGQPGMALYKVETEDTSVQAFPTGDGWMEVRGSSIQTGTGKELEMSVSSTLHDGEALKLQMVSGGIEGLTTEQTVYVVNYGQYLRYRISLIPGGAPLTTNTTNFSSATLRLQRMHVYTFDYPAVAGLPVPVPNPLSNVIGATPPANISGGDVAIQGIAVTPRAYYKDYKGTSWVVAGGGAKLFVKFFYRMQDRFWYQGTDGNQAAAGTPIEWLPGDQVNYIAQWPTAVPVLKVGETLTFAGGEYKADRPDAPGLPGVVGWAAGRVVFDSLTPAMDKSTNSEQSFTDYSARLIAPLETRQIDLSTVMSAAEIATFKEKIGPASGVVTVDGALWRFAKLPASLRDRIFVDPINNRLGMVGYVNGKTLGDETLTASPPPAYILDPNILRVEDRTKLKTFKADAAELLTVGELFSNQSKWEQLVEALYTATRNPLGLRKNSTDNTSNYYTGLDWAPQRDANGNILTFDSAGKPPSNARTGPNDYPAGYKGVPGEPVPTLYRAVPAAVKGPGLALVCGPKLLEFSAADRDYYVTLAENDDAQLGLPVTMHIVKLQRRHRYRGAIKLVEGDNAFSEKVTLRHTADFGGNTEGIEFQWFYRPEDGRSTAVPYNGGSSSIGTWQIYPGVTGSQIDFDAEGKYILPDMWFVARYRHTSDTTTQPSWSSTRWASDGKPEDGLKIGELWAGAANSPQLNGTYLPQLVPGWLKRVLDRINPYEARFTDFRNNDAPATYASMIQQAGAAYEGPVALNSDKNVVENVGLIQLYQTLLDRGKKLGLDPTITDPALQSGIMNALQLAATRVQDLYMVLGNEAYSDSQDPLVGFGSNSAEYGTTATGVWAFMNQTSDALEEELALLRGQTFSFGRPVYNRMFWNFTKDLGEVAYAQVYNIDDVNGDGFINESDAMQLYPMGHGDAWGHYSTAVKLHYDLLKDNTFQWQPRSEFYSLLDTVIPVDFYDERKFAAAAAARVRAGADIVKLTYRQRYTENPDGQWQGYADVDTDRAWGVEGWARRAGQAALMDWAVANSLLPASAPNRGAPVTITSASLLGTSPTYRYNLSLGTGLRTNDANGNPQAYVLKANFGDQSHEIIFRPAGPSKSDTLFFSPAVPDQASSIQIAFQPGITPANLTAADLTLAIYDVPDGIQKVERGTVDALETIARQFAMIENAVADANGGLNPLGLAKDAVPFDIDPAQFTPSGTAEPAGHFEQIYERARKAVANARVIFDGSTGMLNATRANLDSLATFTDEVAKNDRDYRNRLIEIFGTPHEANIGTGKPYPAGYSGPDLFFHPYVDVADVSDKTIPAPPSNSGVLASNYLGFKGRITAGSKVTGGAKDFFLEDAKKAEDDGVLVRYFDGDLPDFEKLNNAISTPMTLQFPITASGYAYTKPAGWGNRAVTGELQTLISEMVQAQTSLYSACADYTQFEVEVESALDTMNARYTTAVKELNALRVERTLIATTASIKAGLQATSIIAGAIAEAAKEASDLAAKTTPTTVIAGLAVGGDALRAAQAAVHVPATASKLTAANLATGAEVASLAFDPIFEAANYNVGIAAAESTGANEVRSQISALQALLAQEKGKRLAIFSALESLRQASDAYRSKLNMGLDLLDERAEFNRSVASTVQKHRYQDMTFRLFRNEALDAYHAAYDLAAKYTWLAAKAYAYETNLPDTHPGAADSIIEGIIGERLIGDLADGEPALGAGLANHLALLRDNYSVLKGQLGINNGQAENSKVSLRSELFRKRSSSDSEFRAELTTYRHANLNLVPEFRRYCRPFAPTNTVQPGLVIPMPTTITAGKNIFGKPLGPADHSFDPSLYATKVQAVGVWFEGYDLGRFASAPRVYLIPAGNDAMLEPNSTTFEPRWWNVVDQRIPVPHAMGSFPLNDPDWRPVADTLDGPIGEIRKFSSFRAYSGLAGASVNPSEMSFDTRLVGRSVWNDRWLLVIPGQTLGADPGPSLDEFLGSNGVKDIHVVFDTIGFSGN